MSLGRWAPASEPLSESGCSLYLMRAKLKGLGSDRRSATEPSDDSPAGKLMETVISSVAQFENEVKAQRTRTGMQTTLELGRWTF